MSISSQDIKYIEKAIQITKKNVGLVAPRPVVGALLVKNGKIIGEGITDPRPGDHAEINAINQAKGNTKNSTLYCTLEPHAFQGISPPCTEAIIKSGIKRVVCPIEDPNPKVSGNGFRQLLSSNIIIDTNLDKNITEKCNKIIHYYKHFLKNKRPFITLKTAMSLDGKIGTLTGDSKWITNEMSRKEVHRLRYHSDGIITGIGTILNDNPRFTSRDKDGNYLGRPRYRIILDSTGKIPSNSKIFDEPGQIIIASTKKIKNLPNDTENLIIPDQNNKVSIDELIRELSKIGLHNLLLESGGTLNANFLKHKLIDQFKIFVGNIIIGGNESLSIFKGQGSKVIMNSLNTEINSIEKFEGNFLITGRIKYPEFII